MNKTVTINISGIIFHIEENAFEKLSRYLNTIKGYFSASEGRDEIMADIEARIAEILKDKTSTTKQVVLMTDVDAVIALMGQPEEFAGDTGSTYSKEEEQTFNLGASPKRKRVFRNPDDKVLGGVCSGISAYFNMDPLWLRLILAISFFAFGFGLLIYILLWIIIPEAKTTAEKLEMHGENVTVDNISKSVKEEMDQLKSRMGKWQNEAKTTSSQHTQRAKHTIDRFGDFLKSVFGPVFKFLGKAIAVFIILISTIIVIGLLSSVFGINDIVHLSNNGDHFSFSLHELLNAVVNDPFQSAILIIGAVLFIVTPLLMLIYWGIKVLFNIRAKRRVVGITANILWLTGLGLCIFSAINIGKNFSKESVNKQFIPIQKPTSDTLYLSLKTSNKYLNSKEEYDTRVKLGNWNFIKNNDQKIIFGNPELNIEPSETDSFEIVMIKSSHGENHKEASISTKSISYEVIQSDSLLEFNPYFDILQQEKFRNQEVKLTLKVPVGKVIYLHKNMKDIIYDIDNVTNTWDGDMIGRKWKMTTEGLECLDCEGLQNYEPDFIKMQHPVEFHGNKNAKINIEDGEVKIEDTDKNEITKINIKNGEVNIESSKKE